MGDITDERLRPRERLRHRGDFVRVYARRCHSSDDWLVIHVAENGLGWSRLGISVGKRVGNAVTRNYAKRRLREAFRRNKERLTSGFDHVCVVRKDLRGGDVERSLLALSQNAVKQTSRRPPRGEPLLKSPTTTTDPLRNPKAR